MTSKLLLALALLLPASFSFAEEPEPAPSAAGADESVQAQALDGGGIDEDDVAASTEAVREAAETAAAAASGGGAAKAGDAAGGKAEGYPGATNFQVYKDLASMPAHQGAHGGMVFNETNGYAVGFFPGPVGKSAHCCTVSSPAFPGQGCSAEMWVSEQPGGAPIGDCRVAVSFDGTGGGCLEITAAASTGPGCALKGGKTRFYCNTRIVQPAEAWFGNVPDMNGVFAYRRKICSTLLTSPLGYPEQFLDGIPAAPPAAAGPPAAPPPNRCWKGPSGIECCDLMFSPIPSECRR